MRGARLERALTGNQKFDRLGAERGALFDERAHGLRPAAMLGLPTRAEGCLIARRLALDRGGYEARSRHPSGIDLLLEKHLELLAQRAGRIRAGEAVIEQDAGIARRGERQLLRGQGHAGNDLLDRARPGEMRMRLDEARHQGIAPALEYPGTLGRKRTLLRPRDRR